MKLPEPCGFGALRESLVRDRLILGVKDDRVRQKLLGKRDLDLDKANETIMASQVTHSRATEISEESFQLTKILMQWGKGRNPSTGKGRMANYLPPRTLPRLKSVSGGTHALERKLPCPASGQKCKKCGKGHFAVKCRSKSEDA